MIEVELNDADFREALNSAAEHLTDLSPLMAALGELVIEDTKQNFINLVGPNGVKWEPKSQATRDAYLRREGTAFNRPLFGASNDLSSDWHSELGPDGASVEVGSRALYASVQQFGAAKGEFGTNANGNPIPWGDIPARPFLGLDDELEDELTGDVKEYIARMFE